MRVTIAGAGVGGLAAAIALARGGHEVEVIERASVLSEVGAGIQISPNAVKALRALGVGDAAEAVASRPEALELRMGRSGAKVFSIPMGEAAVARYGAPYLHLHRADLVEVLRAAAEAVGAKLRFDARVAGYNRREQGVRVGLDTGEGLETDLLVGADGMRSAVRRRMLGDDLPRFTGALAWRVLAPAAAAPDLLHAATVWVGRSRHAVTYRIRGGDLINLVGVVESGRGRGESWDEAGDPKELAVAFAGWAAPIPAIIAAAKTCHRWALFDRDPPPRWSDGRVVLLGDACHPMAPFQAQGAAMAIEDAVTLARCLDEGDGNPEAALMRYEAMRKPRTTKLLASARANMGVFHRSNLITQAATYGPMRLADLMAPAFVRSRQDWIYGYDVTGGWPVVS